MCGIVGYVGPREASPILLKGLQRLEYRGYDSAGITVLNGVARTLKCKGKVQSLVRMVQEASPKGSLGIGHTRWATHGEPNDVNAHPQASSDGRFTLVHNGIIENYASLKAELLAKNVHFESQTDTEVIAHWICEVMRSTGKSFREALPQALGQLTGTFGLAIVHDDYPDRIFIARRGSPLLIGVGEGEHFVASDPSPVVEYTNKVVYLDDDEIAEVWADGYSVTNMKSVVLDKEVHELVLSLEQIEKKGYPHFMLKEIVEQPESVADCLRGRLKQDPAKITLGGIEGSMDKLLKARRLIIAACGTSWHAGLVGEYLFEHLARVPVEVEYASEFRYKDPLINDQDVLLVISQSGETADTLAALRLAKERGAYVIGICNVVGSTIARETDAGVYTHAGPEIGVASTKAFTAQVTVLTMMALRLGRQKGAISDADFDVLTRELSLIPEKIRQITEHQSHIKEIAQLFSYAPNFLYLGRSYNYPVALEGALKLKEISYLHAEGYPAAEMKHGPIALIDQYMPVIVIAATSHTNDKMISNIQEVKARKGRIIAIAPNANQEVAGLAEFFIPIPETEDALSPLLTVIPLQLLSYFVAVNRGNNVDQPRNLAKSVTVE
jgi:glucosamine--fructose-6-phosphate aminotransferase (isomerizing)